MSGTMAAAASLSRDVHRLLRGGRTRCASRLERPRPDYSRSHGVSGSRRLPQHANAVDDIAAARPDPSGGQPRTPATPPTSRRAPRSPARASRHDGALDLQRRRQLAVSCDRSRGRMATFLTCSTRANFSLISSTWSSIALRTSGLVANCGGVLGEAVLLGVGDGFFGVEGDQGDQVGPAVADDDALGDQRVLLDFLLEVGRSDVLTARGDDDVLFAAGDLDEAFGVDLANVAGVQPAVDDRLARSPPGSCGSPGRRSGPGPGSRRPQRSSLRSLGTACRSCRP